MSSRYKSTKSICPKCKRVLDAKIEFENGKTRISRKCPKHGKFVGTHMHDTRKLYEMMNYIHDNDIKIRGNKEDIPKSYEGFLLFINKKCNLDCPICFEGDKKDFEGISKKGIDKIIRKYENNEGFISLSGGEPTIDTNLKSYINKLKKNNFEIYISTNGIKTSEKNFVKKLDELGVKGLSISFEGFNPEVYNKVRGKNIKKKIIKSINNAKNLNMSFTLSSTLLKSNLNEMRDIIELAFEKNASTLTFKPISLSTFNKQEKIKEEIIELSDILDRIKSCLGIEYKNIAKTTQFMHLYNVINSFLNFGTFKNTRCYLYMWLRRSEGKIKNIDRDFTFEIKLGILKILSHPLILRTVAPFRNIINPIIKKTKKKYSGHEPKILEVSIKTSMSEENLDLRYLKECNCNMFFDEEDIESPRSACEYKSDYRSI